MTELEGFGTFTEARKTDKDAMREFVRNGVFQTNMRHDQLKKKFVSKFGSKNLKYFEKYVEQAVEE